MRTLTWFLRGLATGTIAMYLLDPDKGRRRRAIARDRTRRFMRDATDVLDAAAHDVSNRMQGARARASRRMRQPADADDLKLIERVRARIGRVVSNPHAIQVGARQGQVVLSGPVLASEYEVLLHVARSVPGVAGVDDHVVVHAQPGSVPGLQGTGQRTRDRNGGAAAAGPLARAATLVSGAMLAGYGVTRGSLTGLAVAGVGAAIAAGATRAGPASGDAHVEGSAGEPNVVSTQ
jgi:hypothetical protein